MSKTYEELVADQIEEFSKNCPSGCDPVGIPFPGNALWCLPFAEKPVKPVSENTFSLVITDRTTMKLWEIPQKYHAIEVEREIISTKDGVETMIERVYLIRRLIFKEKCVLTTMSSISLKEPNKVSIASQFSPIMGQVRLKSFEALKLRELLIFPAPFTIAFPY